MIVQSVINQYGAYTNKLLILFKMKKVIVVLLASFSLHSFGQKKMSNWSVGIDLAAMTSKSLTLKNEDIFPSEDFSRSYWGYSIGGTLMRTFNDRFSLSLGLDHSKRGFKSYEKIVASGALRSLRRDILQESLEIPVLGHFYFGTLANRPRLKFVLSAGANITTDLKLSNKGYFIDPDFLIVINGKENELPELSPTPRILGSIAPTVGLGIRYQINSDVCWLIQPAIRWDYSLRTNSGEYNTFFNQTTRSIGVKTSLLFNL